MTIVRFLDRLRHMELYGSTQATAANHALRSVAHGSAVDAEVSGLSGVRIVTWQVTGQIMPRCFVSYEDVAVSFPALIVATSGGHPQIMTFIGIRHNRAADIT